MVDSDLCSVVESCGDVLGLVLVNRHLVRLIVNVSTYIPVVWKIVVRWLSREWLR
jgi:hypothetical protein